MKTLLSFFLAGAIFVGAGCGQTTDRVSADSVNVVASFYPLGFVAESVAGDVATVTTVTPAGVDAHDFEPSARAIGEASNADVFLYQGGGIDPWAQEVEAGGVTIEMIHNVATVESEEDEHDHGDVDPHTWLSPVLMQEHTVQVRDALIAVDPENADTYRKNAQELITQLETLDQEFEQGLATCERDTIVVSHDAYGYLSDRYDFSIRAIAGLSPSDEPSAKELAEIATLVEQEGITTIFTEELASPRLAQTIASETGAQLRTLNPLEGLTPDQVDSGDDYLSVMRANLKALQEGLDCE